MGEGETGNPEVEPGTIIRLDFYSGNFSNQTFKSILSSKAKCLGLLKARVRNVLRTIFYMNNSAKNEPLYRMLPINKE